jgi:glutamate formiminotransferase
LSSELVECVPNFSEGRDTSVIESIAESIRRVDGAKLLSVEPDKDYNRTVVTFVGSPKSVVEAAFQATRVAGEQIDMRRHRESIRGWARPMSFPSFRFQESPCATAPSLAEQYGERVATGAEHSVFLYEERHGRRREIILPTFERENTKVWRKN